jgi:hypothetical protein
LSKAQSFEKRLLCNANPWKAATLILTRQAQMIKNTLALAATLAKEAGVEMLLYAVLSSFLGEDPAWNADPAIAPADVC